MGRRDVTVAVGLAVGGILLLLLLTVQVVEAGAEPDRPWVAWLGLLALAVAGLWLPVMRWRRWPPPDRLAALRAVARASPPALALAMLLATAGVAAVLVLQAPEPELLAALWRAPLGPTVALTAVGVVALVYSLRPVTPLAARVWAARRLLPMEAAPRLAAEVRRLRVWRTVPALLGASIGMAPSAAANLAIEVQGRPPGVAAQRLMDGRDAWPLDPVLLALLGYFVGAAVAEATRRRPAMDADGAASLEVRTPAQYLTPLARLLPPGLAAVAVAAMLVGWSRWGIELVWPLPTAIGLASATWAVHRWVVRRPQRIGDPARLALDDALRSSAAHATAGAAAALLLILALGALQRAALGPDGGSFGGVLGIVVGLLDIFGVVALWLNYGSAHRGRVPARDLSRSVG